MTAYDMIKAQMGTIVPFATHTGVVLTDVADGKGRAELAQTPTTINHIQTQHAGALFTLGEAASGAAMAGAFASVLMQIRPVASTATINYKRPAKGLIRAEAHVERPGAQLLAELEADAKVAFNVQVTMMDEQDKIVAEMAVEWHVSKT